jgi:predicted RNase H-like HicB family nuclease
MELPYTYWQDDGWYLGYLDTYPEHWTQGKTLKELEEMLLDLYEIFKKDAAHVHTEKKAGILKVSA